MIRQRDIAINPPRRIALILAAIVVTLLIWPQLGRRSGTINSIRELPAIVPMSDDLASFPAFGKIHWNEYPERPRRIRLTGRVDVDRFYSWAFGRARIASDTGAIIRSPHPSGEIGEVGDRYYETDGTTSVYRYNVRVLLDGRFQLDLHRRPGMGKDS